MEKVLNRKLESIDFFRLQFLIVIALQFVLQSSDKVLINIYEAIITLSFLISIWAKRKYSLCNSDKYKALLLIFVIYTLRFTIVKIGNLQELMNSDEFTIVYFFIIGINIIMNLYVLYSLYEIGFNLKYQGLSFYLKSLPWSITFFSMSIILGIILLKMMIPTLTYNMFYQPIFWSCFIIEIISGAFIEEVLFRGVLLSYLVDKFSNITSSSKRGLIVIIANTLIFMLVHGWARFLNPIVVISFVVISVFGCLSKMKTGNILYATILHAMYNSMVV